MGLDKRMKKRIQQIDKNLDAIVKNPYEKKEIIEKKPKNFPAWTRWAVPLGGALLTCSLALGIVIPTAVMGAGKGGQQQGAAESAGKGVSSDISERPTKDGSTPFSGLLDSILSPDSHPAEVEDNHNDYDVYSGGTYTPETLNRLITPTHQALQPTSTQSGMSYTTFTSYWSFSKKFVALAMAANNPASDEKSLAVSIPDAYLSLAITGIISDQDGLQDVLDYLELDNADDLKNAAREIVTTLGTIGQNSHGNYFGGLNLNSIWLNPTKVQLLEERDEDLYEDLRDVFNASLYHEGLTSNRAKQYIAQNGLPNEPVPDIRLDTDLNPAALSVMSVYYDLDVFEEERDSYHNEFLTGTHTMDYTFGGQTKQVDYIGRKTEYGYIVENDNLIGTSMDLDHSQMKFFLPKDETAMPSTILQDVLDTNYSHWSLTYTDKNGEEKTTNDYSVNISAPYFFMNNKVGLDDSILSPIFPNLTSGGMGSRLVAENDVFLASIDQFSVMRFDYNGFYSCSATIVSGERSAGPRQEVNFVLNRPYVFERTRSVKVAGTSNSQVPIIVGEIVDPDYHM